MVALMSGQSAKYLGSEICPVDDAGAAPGSPDDKQTLPLGIYIRYRSATAIPVAPTFLFYLTDYAALLTDTDTRRPAASNIFTSLSIVNLS